MGGNFRLIGQHKYSINIIKEQNKNRISKRIKN